MAAQGGAIDVQDAGFRPLLWEELRGRIRPAEVEEIERVIGVSTIERNADLKRECRALHEILVQFQEQNDVAVERAEERGPPPPSPMREFLVKQITMLAAHLTKQRGVVSAVPLLQEPADRKVLRALLEETPPETGRTAEQTASRPLSARTRPESSASSRPSRPVSRASSASSRSESSGIRGPADGLLHVVDAVEPGLTADGIDEVACTIRSALNEEAALLRDQISLLQASLEQEDQFRTASTGAGGGGAWPPTEDLRRVSHRLEALVAAARRSHTVERLLTDSAARRRRASSAGAGHARLAPLPGKAAASDASTGAAAMPPRPAAGGADRGRPRGDGSGDAANGAPEAARGSARSSRARRLREEVLEARYLV